MRYWLIFLIMVLGLPVSSLAQEKLVVQNAVKSVTLTGYTRSNRLATVSCEVSGKIIKVNYDVGQVIGDEPFFEIDQTFIDLDIQTTRQSLQKMEVALKQSASKVDFLKKEYDRIEKLRMGDSTTAVKRDAAKEDYDQAGLAYEALQVDVAMQKTRLAELNERKKRYRIMAHQGWVVVRKIAEIGEVVGPGSQLARIADFQKLVVPLSVSAQEFNAIKAKPAMFEARLDGKPIMARLDWVNPQFDERTRKLGIEISIQDDIEEKRGGLQFSLALELQTQGLLVPKMAVSDRYENPRVTLKETGKTISILVLGENNGDLLIASHPMLGLGTELIAQTDRQP